MPRQEDTPMHESTPGPAPAVNPYQSEQDGEEMTSQATQSAQDASASVKESAGQYMEQGREQVTSRLGDQKLRLTEGLGSFTEAIRVAGQRLEEQDQRGIAQFVDQGAEQIDQMTRYLQDRDVNELMGDFESFARERPALFLGGAFGLGLIAARFIKSSGRQAGSTRY